MLVWNVRSSRRLVAAAGGALAVLGFSVLLVLANVEWRSARRQEALLQVLAVPAQRELENFEVSLDGTIIAREPNGDVIEMSPPGWTGWLKKVEKDGAQRELENYEVALDGNIIAREPNGDVIEMSPPAWREWIEKVEKGLY